MSEPQLTIEAKEAIRIYIRRLVTLPASLGTIIAVVLGFLVTDVWTHKAYQEAYDKASDRSLQIMEQINRHALEGADAAARAAAEAEVETARLQRLVEEVKKVKRDTDRLKGELQSAENLSKIVRGAGEAVDEAIGQVVKLVMDETGTCQRL